MFFNIVGHLLKKIVGYLICKELTYIFTAIHQRKPAQSSLFDATSYNAITWEISARAETECEGGNRCFLYLLLYTRVLRMRL